MSDALVCILSTSGDAPTDALRRRFDRAADRDGLARFTWTSHGRLTVGLSSGAGGWTVQCRGARRGSLVAAGSVRLDNRREVARWCATRETEEECRSDLDLTLQALDARGSRCIPHLLGDFCFVVWDAHDQALIAVRDALGIRPLFVREDGGRVLLSTRAALLTPEPERIDLEFVADYLVGSHPSGRTVYEDVRPVPPGSIVRWSGGSSTVERYWSADQIEIDERLVVRPEEQSQEFRRLFAEAVRTRVEGAEQVWSQLSGGLDSSSVVSMAQWLVETGRSSRGIAGTVTHVPGMGGDEREYSDTIVERYGVRNEVFADHWMFQDDGAAPPLTDQPYPAFPMYARDRRSAWAVRSAGGTVLLTGHGSDQYLTGNRYFIADDLARGRLSRAARATVVWAVAERQSVWWMGFRYGVAPMLPPWLQRHLLEGGAVPAWILPSFARRFALRDRLPLVQQFTMPGGRKFDGPVIQALAYSSSGPAGGVTDEIIESRFPFLHRPLLEFGLRLPPSMRIRPRTTKWIQREAMRGILPEKVRCRRTKGAIDGRLEWSLAREHNLIEALLTHSVLGELKCIDINGVRRALEAARGGDSTALGTVVPLLSLESWLQVRIGRWSLGSRYDRLSTSSKAVG